MPAEKTGGGSPAHLPASSIDQLELLEKKNCHNSHFPTANEKQSGSQPDFSASLLDQSELAEKPNNSGEDFNSAAESQPVVFEVAEELPNNSGQGRRNAAESQPVVFEVAAFHPHTPLFKQLVVADLGQPSLGDRREQSPRRERREQTPSMNPGALDQMAGYVFALSPEAPNASKAPKASSAPVAPKASPALFGHEHSASTRSQNQDRASRHQPHLPKNLDGSDRLPWDTDKRGVFDPKFENWMARSLMQYPAYRDLMAGELMTLVRKHISAGRYDLKRRDELLIEWSAMHEHPNASDVSCASSTLTAKAAARRAKIARALSMEVS